MRVNFNNAVFPTHFGLCQSTASTVPESRAKYAFQVSLHITKKSRGVMIEQTVSSLMHRVLRTLPQYYTKS